MGWSSMEEMPPGFRFYPTEEELVSFYLPQKLEGRGQNLDRVIPLLDVYDFNPWDLPQYAGEVCRGDPEQWFFFIPRQEKEARGGRPSRLTESGYWKATGSPGFVYSNSGNNNNPVIGEKRSMVFYKGRAPHGEKTEWKMNEYTAIDASSTSTTTAPKLRREISLCRVYIKSKCLRAFDRRPSSAGVTINEGRNQLQAREADEPIRASNPYSSMPPERRNSTDHSSSSEDHAIANNASQNMEIDKKVDSVGNNPLWEWEQLNLF